MPVERELSQRKISGMQAIVQIERGEPIPRDAAQAFGVMVWGFAAAHERFRMLDGDVVMAVRDGLKDWADRASAEDEPLLRWASEHPDGAALRERWARDLASSASSILAPGWAWLLDADDGEIQQPISDAELDDFLAPLPADLILRALSDATRLEVLKVIDLDAPRANGWGKRWLRWWRWLGVEVNPKDNGVVWAGWVEARYLRALLQDAWLGRWRGEAAEIHKRSSRISALTTRMAGLVATSLSPATVVQRHEDRIELVGLDGRTVGRMDDEHVSATLTSWRGPVVDAAMVCDNADRLVKNARTAAGVASFWHALHMATSLSRRGLDLRAEWPSWNAWANEAAELAEIKLDPNLRRLLYDSAWYGNTVQLLLFDGRWSRGLWTLTAPDPHKRGRPAAGEARAVAFRYGDVLDPGWARRENPTDRNRGVHLLGLPDRLPVHVGDRAAKAPAQLYTLLLLAEVCERSDHERVADGAEVSAAARRELAARAGLHHDHEPVQLRGLLDDGLLVEVRGGRDRYALGDEKARALRAHTRPTKPGRPARR